MEILERKKQLKGILAFIKECGPEIIRATQQDLGKPAFETSVLELGPINSETAYALDHLDAWTRPKKVSTPFVSQPGHSWIEYQPLGKVLIIAPWNYPFQLTLSPLISAIAAGNTTVIKPSELAPASAHVLAQKLPNYVDTQVFEGGPEQTQALLAQRWDHIFYTGGERVARIVLEKAAQYLTPTTLELGGKSPVIVDESAHLELSARRIAWGKFINAGQTCVAPDYALVHEKIKQPFITELRKAITTFFGSDPQQSRDYGRIINQAHTQRLHLMSPNSTFDLEQRYFEPTILELSGPEHPTMQEEIFGPILPVLGIQNINQAIEFINSKPKPLALYCFASNRNLQKQVLENTQSGGVCINDTVSHLGNPELPFGGVGGSGFGAYHGRWGFERLSHAKAVYARSNQLDIPLRYPPYSQTALKIANWFQS